jgi:hypothetical protein
LCGKNIKLNNLRKYIPTHSGVLSPSQRFDENAVVPVGQYNRLHV